MEKSGWVGRERDRNHRSYIGSKDQTGVVIYPKVIHLPIDRSGNLLSVSILAFYQVYPSCHLPILCAVHG